MWESYSPRQYDLAMMRQDEIARKAELARLLGSDRKGRAAGVLGRRVARRADQHLADKYRDQQQHTEYGNIPGRKGL